jgi:predicted small metal-binding protein
MAKILECAKVDPSSGCQHIVRGETEEEVLQKAAEREGTWHPRVTPELIERVKANIRDAWLKVLSVTSTHGAVSLAPCFPSCPALLM